MILGRGKAKTNEEVIAEYRQFLKDIAPVTSKASHQARYWAPDIMCRRIGKPLDEWRDEDILTLYQQRSKTICSVYNTFLTFLFFRGYRRATVPILEVFHADLSRHWRPALVPYTQKITQAQKELGYTTESTSSLLNLLLWTLVFTLKPLEELTREVFDDFREIYHQWYRAQRRSSGAPNPRLFRIEQILIHWGILPPAQRVFRHEQYFALLQQSNFRHAITCFIGWYEAKYEASTIDSARSALLSFFLWLQERYPACERLDEVTREIALAYGHYLKHLVETGRYGTSHQRTRHSYVRLFFDFVIDERLETSPSRNPFSARDLPPAPDMLPRYLSDQELRAVLTYCEQEATLLERTTVITLLHTGIRAMEYARIKATDIVQIGGVWKLHVHLGKGLKDRMIPLTSQCLAALQTWQEQGWERANDFLFTRHGKPWQTSSSVTFVVHKIGKKLGLASLGAHRFRHSFAVALLNYGMRESALQKLMGHADLGMTLEYARILDRTVEQSFTQALDRMESGAHSWVPNFFVQEDYTLFLEGDAVSWIRLPLGYCRRNAKLHCESDVKCLLCDRFAIGKEDLPRLKLMYDRFMKLGLNVKADVVAAQIQRLELSASEVPAGFIPATAISVMKKSR